MRIEALITPRIVQWARERCNLNYEAVAQKVKVSADTIAAWEKGDVRPTIRQAQKLAQKLGIPFGYLYLSTPPVESLPLPDLRNVEGAPPHKPSPNFLDVLYDAFRKQDWFREYLQEEDAPKLKFVNSFKPNGVKNIGQDVRDTLGIDDKLRQSCSSWEQFLTEFIRRAEQARILVLRSNIVGSSKSRLLDVNEFRGFAISDNLAPLIFINEADYKVAQIFTLAHELVHLWIGQSGISKPNYMLRSKEQNNVIEQFCDRAAAEILVPKDDFLNKWNHFYSLNRNLDRLARHYRVSQFVILRRAHEFDEINDDEFQIKYHQLLEKAKPKKPDGFRNYYSAVLSRNSPTLTSTLVLAASEGRALPTEAARLLNIGVIQLKAIENYILFIEPRHG